MTICDHDNKKNVGMIDITKYQSMNVLLNDEMKLKDFLTFTQSHSSSISVLKQLGSFTDKDLIHYKLPILYPDELTIKAEYDEGILC